MDSNTDSARVPCVVVAAADPTLRDELCWTILGELPASRMLRYDVVTLPAGPGFRRTVSQSGCVLDQREIDVTTNCMTCALRIDLLVALEQLRRTGLQPVVLGLPVGTNLASVLAALGADITIEPPLSPADIREVVLAVNPATLIDDLTGDDLLADRAQQWGESDRRSVGEVLAAAIDFADHVVPGDSHEPTAHAMLAHLAGDRTISQTDLAGSALLNGRRDRDTARRRIDPRHTSPPGTTTVAGAWTLDLASWRPAHPERLNRRLPDLATGRLRGRGRFWLPTRPHTLCVWDNAGSQLSIGDGGDWNGSPPSTRLVITGIDIPDRDRILIAFDDMLMTDSELVRGLPSWIGRDDGLDAWLGTRTTA